MWKSYICLMLKSCLVGLDSHNVTHSWRTFSSWICAPFSSSGEKGIIVDVQLTFVYSQQYKPSYTSVNSINAAMSVITAILTNSNWVGHHVQPLSASTPRRGVVASAYKGLCIFYLFYCILFHNSSYTQKTQIMTSKNDITCKLRN